MLKHVGNLKASELELQQQLSALECDWLTGCLHARIGVPVAALRVGYA